MQVHTLVEASLAVAFLAGCGWLAQRSRPAPASPSCPEEEAVTPVTSKTETRLPPIDVDVPRGVETATFALG